MSCLGERFGYALEANGEGKRLYRSPGSGKRKDAAGESCVGGEEEEGQLGMRGTRHPLFHHQTVRPLPR